MFNILLHCSNANVEQFSFNFLKKLFSAFRVGRIEGYILEEEQRHVRDENEAEKNDKTNCKMRRDHGKSVES